MTSRASLERNRVSRIDPAEAAQSVADLLAQAGDAIAAQISFQDAVGVLNVTANTALSELQHTLAAALADDIAPEHLEICVDNPLALANNIANRKDVRNIGALL